MGYAGRERRRDAQGQAPTAPRAATGFYRRAESRITIESAKISLSTISGHQPNRPARLARRHCGDTGHGHDGPPGAVGFGV